MARSYLCSTKKKYVSDSIYNTYCKDDPYYWKQGIGKNRKRKEVTINYVFQDSFRYMFEDNNNFVFNN